MIVPKPSCNLYTPCDTPCQNQSPEQSPPKESTNWK